MFDVESWLSTHHSDGINLSIRELIYYQGKTGLINLSPRKTVQAKLAGAYLAKTKGRGMEFDEARHYQAGDDIRAIDWRVTARTGTTHTKIYREEKERPVFVLADMSQSMQFGTQLMFKSVQTAHLSALLAWAARKRGDRIGGLIFNQYQHIECKPLTRQKAVLSFLNGLIKVQAQSINKQQETISQHAKAKHKVTFADACARLRRLAHPGSLVFLLSDFSQLDEVAKQHISQLSKHCEVIAYPISDPFEHELPKVKISQRLAMTDGVDQQHVMLGETSTESRYSEQHQAYFSDIEKTLKQCKAQVVSLSAGLPLELQLNQFSRTSS